ncbi:MAG TPA: hypothetical protein VFG04_26770 [Planctomycetaceae bacterium]|jgi:hypothetical protein|nr:hypothetical protein [Planctomycetaceae bacterium]
MDGSDLEYDVCHIIEFFLALAEQDAELVAAFLKSAGFEPGTSFPQATLLKLGLWCRLAYWEEIGLTSGSDDDLPSSRAVFADIIAQLSGETTRFELLQLGQRVHSFALRRLTWPQTSGTPTFVLDDRSNPSDFFDSVAEFLWNHRHLAASAVNSLPAAADADGMEL